MKWYILCQILKALRWTMLLKSKIYTNKQTRCRINFVIAFLKWLSEKGYFNLFFLYFKLLLVHMQKQLDWKSPGLSYLEPNLASQTSNEDLLTFVNRCQIYLLFLNKDLIFIHFCNTEIWEFPKNTWVTSSVKLSLKCLMLTKVW